MSAQIKIIYPRVCECGYSANNPAMWGYHKVTHQPIPTGSLCYHGCSQLATRVTTQGFYICADEKACPALVERVSRRVTADWSKPSSIARREVTKEKFIIAVHNPEARQRGKAAQQIRLFSLPNLEDRRRYNYQVLKLTEMNMRANGSLINPFDHKIGRRSFHVDHVVSRHIGYMLRIPPIYMAHVENLQVIPATQNIQKASKCLLHPLELLTRCNAPANVIESVRSKLLLLGDSLGLLLPQHN